MMRTLALAIAALALTGCVHAPLLNGIQNCKLHPTGPCAPKQP